MANDNIYRYTIETIENYYPRIMKIKMANNLIRDGIATKNKKETDKIFVGDKEDYNRIAFCLEKDSRLIKYIENWEYEKYFKYSIFIYSLFYLPQSSYFSKSTLYSPLS